MLIRKIVGKMKLKTHFQPCKFIVVYYLVISCTSLYSQQKTEIFDLVAKLTAKSETDDKKLEAIFDWVTSNIKYDHKAAKTDISKFKPIAEILQSKSAICTGYANMMKEMCAISGIECRVVSGYARSSSDQKISDAPDHAWNAVRLGDKWFLLDATWSIQKNGIKYYLADPESMIQSHLPAQRWWQLMKHPVSYDDFNNENMVLMDSLPEYNFADTITNIYQGSQVEIKIKEAEEAALFYPSAKNKREYASVLMEIAGEASDALSSVMDTTDIGWLHGRFEYILDLCRKSSKLTDLLPTQKELYTEVLLNYTASLYNTSIKRSEEKLKHLVSEAKNVLDNTPNSYYTQHARQLLISYEEIIGLKK
jgi:hypothetical protein